MTIHQSHAIGLLAGLRDGWMTTHFDPVFHRESTLGALPNRGKLRRSDILRCSHCTAAQARKTAACADSLVSVAGLTELNGGFRLDVFSTP